MLIRLDMYTFGKENVPNLIIGHGVILGILQVSSVGTEWADDLGNVFVPDMK